MGAWIEIDAFIHLVMLVQGRTPRWVRGLKSIGDGYKKGMEKSHPTMGAWIEIAIRHRSHRWPPSHPTMGAWIEI